MARAAAQRCLWILPAAATAEGLAAVAASATVTVSLYSV